MLFPSSWQAVCSYYFMIFIRMKAFSKDPEFYSFVETLSTYKETLGKESSLIMGTDSDYFKFLKKLSPDEVIKPGITRNQMKGNE